MRVTGLNGLAFGDFNGLAGPAVVGKLTFKALATGRADITLNANLSGPNNPGPFVSATTFVPQNVGFTGASIDILQSLSRYPQHCR